MIFYANVDTYPSIYIRSIVSDDSEHLTDKFVSNSNYGDLS